MHTALRVVALFCFAARAFAADYEMRLLPITVRDLPGAFQTTWSTRAFGIHEADNVLVRGFDWGHVGPPPIRTSAGEAYEARVYSTDATEPPGSVVYVPREVSSQVHLVSAVVNGADEVYLPVVPENAFTTAQQYFTGVFPGGGERLMLRAYSLDFDRPDASVRVQITAREVELPILPPIRVIRDVVFPLRAVQQTIVHGDESGQPELFKIRPLAVQVDLDELLRGIELPPGPVTIIVTPAAEGIRTWSFVSETHNDSQRVQLILPQ